MRITQTIMAAAVTLMSVSILAGDLAVDNLTVVSNAAIYGKLDIKSEITNEVTATGGTITTIGNYRIHTFTNVGTTNFTVSGGSLQCEVLVVAGGGAGGFLNSGGGGAGGLIYTNITVSGAKTVIVGGGGASNWFAYNNESAVSSNGFSSSFGTIEAIGGGGGGTYGDTPIYPAPTNMWGRNGGSGGGALLDVDGSYGTGIPGQGHDGGDHPNVAAPYAGAGGGGAGEAGHSVNPGIGGDGLEYPQFASVGGSPAGWFAGGGGAGGNTGAGAGGQGGGGAGGGGTDNGTSGTPNTGGGGGGAGNSPTHGNDGAGGSGIVIVRYATTNVTTLTISSNGINQAGASGTNVFMGKVGIGTANPTGMLHVVGNVRVDGTISGNGAQLTNIIASQVGALASSSNLSDITNPSLARANLGLDSAATHAVEDFDAAGTANVVSNALATQLSAHTSNNNNPHNVTASQVEALSTTGGVVNGSLDVNGALSLASPAGDIPMGIYTNQ